MSTVKEYEKLKKELHDAILKKKALDKKLNAIEEDIYARETTYLAESTGGNIVRGLEQLAKASTASAAATGTGGGIKKKPLFTDDDRIFSLSSYTYVRHLQKSSELDDESAEGTPVSTGGSGAQRKRKRGE